MAVGRAKRDLGARQLLYVLRKAAEPAMSAWRAPGARDRQCDMPFGVMEGRDALAIHAADLLVHSWDLAEAIGRVWEVDDDLAIFALAVEERLITEDMRGGPGKAFAHAVPTGSDASPQERLLA